MELVEYLLANLPACLLASKQSQIAGVLDPILNKNEGTPKFKKH